MAGNARQRTVPVRGGGGGAAPYAQQTVPMRAAAVAEEVFNIIPIHSLVTDHPSLRYPEVRAVTAALMTVGDLRLPDFVPGRVDMDLLDWLGACFGFQIDNVRNQRENLVLQLANAQMRLQPPPANLDVLDGKVLRAFRKKLLKNYSSWCSYVGKRSSVWLTNRHNMELTRRELLYVALYLLIWGEAANLRFMPECLCYIFHHMAMELNQVLEEHIDENTGRPYVPYYRGENAFLRNVVKPIYNTIKKEVESGGNGSKPHSAWRNYDDLNEYFWSRRCLKSLKWPLNVSSNFFMSAPEPRRVGKTGFVEQRSFWNVFRSFDRLWVLLILFFQAAAIVSWDGDKNTLDALGTRDVQVELLTIFITWSGLRLVQSVLDAGTQYSLASRDTKWIVVRMVLKSMDAIAWTVIFGVFYGRIWNQKNADGRWSNEAYNRIIVFLKAVLVFITPELLALILFILPWVRNFLENLDWRILSWLSWWFQTRTFVGRGLREGPVSNIKYSMFWVIVLASKFLFSYFLQIRPLVSPTKALLKLRTVDYRWHEFFNNTNRLAVVVLWLPVILIYLMDLQIWYSIFSSIVGSVSGLFLHLGEIRNIEQLRLRFQFFASAMQFNLMPEEQLFSTQVTALKKLRDRMHRLKLRYGLGLSYTKIESSQVEATRFALLWNEINITLREEDLISDGELELLELTPNSWNIRVIRWPCILLCNELRVSLQQAAQLSNRSDSELWEAICNCKNGEYKRCAIIEAYDSVKYLLLTTVKYGTTENYILTNLFKEIDHHIETGELTKVYNMNRLPEIHEKLILLINLLLKPNHKRDLSKVVDVLQALYELAVREFPKEKRSAAQLKVLGLAPANPAENEDLLFENVVQFIDEDDIIFYRQLRRLHTILTSRDSPHSVPKNLEARRRITFFSNSLFMNIPRAPQVEKMLAFSVLTPYYDEEVMFGKEMLRKENEDGISTLFYLQKIFVDEWENFIERMRRGGMKDDNEIWATKVKDLRLWASYRGQTLSRTVRGMMYYYRALKMLAFLDLASEMDIREGSDRVASHVSMNKGWGLDGIGRDKPPAKKLNRATTGVSLLYKGHEYGTALMKFTYVVTCQLYGVHKAKGDHRAEDILYLMKNNEALRVAYVDEVCFGREEVEYYSVLVKFDPQQQKEVEIYRIRLPGPVKLGEGKPENQNHAIIFTRGDALQTIDMNQDNYFEEALKMRNLLEEFKAYHGIRKPTILGIRENIFTGSVSSLAWFMSAQESTFVTLGQRVLANPLKVRMHYGHPDVFDRFWFLTRGGVSKASRLINISEDIFAGFNCTLRGGNVTHHEYIQVGKGRDVGLNQITNFEAKVASGNGEQVLSRDVYRLGHRLDFFRMLSFYYTTVGFFFNTMMVTLTVYAFLWGRLYLALSGVEKAAMSATNNKALGTIVNQQFVVQLGLFTALPLIMETSLEHGFMNAIWNFLMMQLQLASVFFTFSLGTRTHYFGRTILHGGAKYRPTGRGFVVEHKSFAENYRLYARSHFVKAIELGIILTVYAYRSPVSKNTFIYIALTISSWFLVFSWIMAPFVFNPSGFDWLKTVYDFDEFINWLYSNGGPFLKADQSWETWWYEEQGHLRSTGLWGKLLEIILDMRFFFFQYGVVYQLKITSGNTSIAVYLISWLCMIAAVGLYVVIAYVHAKYAAKEHIKYRLVQLVVTSIIVMVLALLLKFTDFEILDLFASLLAFIPTGWGMISIAQVLKPFLETTVVWDTVVSVARLYDLLLGVIVMAHVAFFSWMPGFQAMQTRILFNEAFSRGLQISRIVTGKKSN